MIRILNTGDYQINMVVPGTLATTSVDLAGPLPFPGQIKAVFARLGTAGVTGTMSVDVLKNGATMMSSGSLLSFATTATVPTYNTANLLVNPPAVAKGDLLKLAVTGIQSTAAIDLYVTMNIERTRDGAMSAAMETDTASYRSDNVG